MIVPMKKISLIITGDKKHDTLKKLQRAGIVHIEISEGSGKKIGELKEQISLLERAVFCISEKKNKTAVQQMISPGEALAAAEEIALLSEQKKNYTDERTALISELERIRSWGDIEPEKIAQLKKSGISLSFYEMPLSEYGSLPESIKTVSLEKTKNSVKFAVIESDGTADNALNEIKGFRFELPVKSTSDMNERLARLTSLTEEADKRISDFAVYKDAMKNAVKVIGKEIEFETYATGMADERLSSDGKKEVSVSYFTGFIEEENLPRIQKIARDSSWGLLIEEPTEEDNVPTKLKNNKLVSLIYPLTDFLGTVPGYFEYDISGWFLGFILIFFGIIFGDGLYGLLITAAAGILIIKAKKEKKEISPAFLLVGLFGLSTVFWGTLTCTWGGLPAEKLPEWLQAISIPFISNVYEDKIWYPFWTDGTAGLTTAQNLQIFCFTLALIQLVAAHIIVAKRNRRSIKIIGDLGSIFQLIGIYYVVLSFVVNPEVFPFGLVIGAVPVGTIALILVGVGFVMSFVFSNFEGSIVRSVLESLKNIVSVLLGVVNVFSDIVSYIRLWAVGLAGAAISATVNELASPMLGNFMLIVIAVVLLVFGHGLNMILNVLSVIVHGIRLNTLEFSSHLDMSWSGHKFKPFNEDI